MDWGLGDLPLGVMGRPAQPAIAQQRRQTIRAKRRAKAERQARATKAAKHKPARCPGAKKVEAICRRGINGYDPYLTAAPGDWFDPKAAHKAVRFFFRDLTHVKGSKAGQPFILEGWQIAVIGNLFGWKREDGTRRYRTCLFYVPRKNGKTPLAAGVILYGLFEDGEPGAEIYGAASEYKQASLVFHHARGMVAACDRLKHRCKVFGESTRSTAKAIQLDSDFSTYLVVSSDGYSAHGWNTHMGVVDELHTQQTGDLVEALETSTAARDNPMILYLTTADYEREGSVCNDIHDRAMRAKAAKSFDELGDSSFLPVIYQASKDDDWHSEDVWTAANPNLGVSVKWEYFRAAYNRAKSDPTYENTFKRLHLNIRTEQDTRWFSIHDWDLCVGGWNYKQLQDVDPFEGRECWAGLDLASRVDLSACALVFKNGQKWQLRPFFFLPRDAALHDKPRRARYMMWANAGLLELIPGKVMNFSWIRDRLLEICERYRVNAIGFDPWNAKSLADLMKDDYGVEMVEVKQTSVGLNEACRTFETAIAAGNIEHGGHPIMRQHAQSVGVLERAGGLIQPTKSSSTDRIDGIVSAVTGLALAIRGIGGDGVSGYETESPVEVEW